MFAAGLLTASLVVAAPAGPSFEGYTGLFAVPNALTTAEGTVDFLYSGRAIPPFDAGEGRSRTFTLSVGVLSFAEVGGRVTEVAGSSGADAVRLRDLSLNLKVQAPLHRWNRWLPAVAVGTQDEGGAAPHFRTRYVVATQHLWRLRLSAGWGTGPDRLRGPFGGVEALLHPTTTAIVEHDGDTARAGARLSLPLTVAEVPLRASLLAATPLRRPGEMGPAFGELELALHVTAPLDLTRPPLPAAVEERLPAAPSRSLQALQDALVAEGFENVRVGALAGSRAVVIEYENAVFNWAERDGVQVVLGHLTRHVPEGFGGFVLRVLHHGVAVAELAGPLGEAGVPRLVDARVRTVPDAPEGVTWAGASPAARNATPLHARLTLSPGLRTFLATEAGLFDFVLSVRPELTVPLWRGAAVHARWDVPFAWSRGLAPGGELAPYRGRPRIDHALLYQGGRLAPGLMGLAGVGLFRAANAGVLGELWWGPGRGAYQFGLQAAYTRALDGTSQASLLGSWRGWTPGGTAFVGVRAGQFFHGDRGATLELGRVFGDTFFSLFATHTRHQTGRTVIGGAISLPLTPRRDMKPSWVQVRGSSRWRYQQATVVREPVNAVAPGVGVLPTTGYNLEDAWFDGGRTGPGLRPSCVEKPCPVW